MHRVLVVGDSFFAETLKGLLSTGDQVEVAGGCAKLEQLPTAIATYNPDAVIVADNHERCLCTGIRLRTCNELPIIYTALTDDSLTIFTSRRVKAAQVDLIAAICALPTRS